MSKNLTYALPHLLMLAVSVALYAAAMRIDSGGAGGRIGPDFWPRVVIAVMAALCLYEAVKRLVLGRGSEAGLADALTAQPAAVAEGAEAPPEEPEREYPRLLLAGTALVIGYVLAVPYAGFFITTAVFLAGFSWLGGFRRPWLNLGISLAGALLLVVLFMRVAYISLPLGEGPFRAVSLALITLLGVK